MLNSLSTNSMLIVVHIKPSGLLLVLNLIVIVSSVFHLTSYILNLVNQYSEECWSRLNFQSVSQKRQGKVIPAT